MIETLNERFVSTWVIIDEVRERLGPEHEGLAEMLVYQHQYPLDFVFLSSAGRYVGRLTSFKDLPGAHPAVGHPRRERTVSHVEVFLDAVKKHFGG